MGLTHTGTAVYLTTVGSMLLAVVDFNVNVDGLYIQATQVLEPITLPATSGGSAHNVINAGGGGGGGYKLFWCGGGGSYFSRWFALWLKFLSFSWFKWWNGNTTNESSTIYATPGGFDGGSITIHARIIIFCETIKQMMMMTTVLIIIIAAVMIMVVVAVAQAVTSI